MKASWSYHVRRSIAILAGGGLIGLSAWYTWTHFMDPSAPVAAVVGAGMVHFAEAAWIERQRVKSLMFWALACLASLICLSASLDRTSSTKDKAVAERREHNQRYELALEAKNKAETKLESKEALVSEKCVDGRGPHCKSAQAERDTAKTEAEERRAELAQTPAPLPEDSGASRTAALLPFLTAEQISLYQPALLPVWLDLGGLLLMSYGLAPSRHVAEEKPKRRKKRKLAKRKTVRRIGNVVPFRAAANDG